MSTSKHDSTRRGVIRSLLGGSLLLPGIISNLLAAEAGAQTSANPLAPKEPHFPAKAKRVIFICMSGGLSHIESFDPKPKLITDNGKSISRGKSNFFIKKPYWDFKRYGKSGTEVNDLFPHMGECVDDMCVIRSMKNDHNNHVEATLGIHTGSVIFTRPSIGSWLSYGLGTSNQNLPAFVVLAPEMPYAGNAVWGSDFLPAIHQGVRIIPGSDPIPNLARRAASPELQEMELGLANYFNRRHFEQQGADTALAARIKSFETAYGMQKEAPEVFDVSAESDATLKLYGLERGTNEGFAWQCLMARRLAERGVRFIELVDTGAAKNWDAHSEMGQYVKLAKNVDQPIAGLLKDLKSRGMLADTLVVWTTEFGRTSFVPSMSERGRNHHASVYSSWMAGGGIKGGMVYGESDDYGIEVAKDMVHIHDFHATILHLMGLDHERLTFQHAGRDFRLTDVHGRIVKEIFA